MMLPVSVSSVTAHGGDVTDPNEDWIDTSGYVWKVQVWPVTAGSVRSLIVAYHS